MREEFKTVIWLAIVYTALILVFYYVFSSDILSMLYYNENLRHILLAIKDGIAIFLAAFTIMFTGIALPKVFSGSVMKYISNALMLFGGILLLHFHLTSPFVNPELQTLSGYIFITAATVLVFSTAYYVSREYNQRLLPSTIKASAFFVVAFLARELLLEVPWEYSEYVATAAAVGLIFTGVTALFYPLKFSSNQIFKKTGGWFSSSTKDKFILGFFITLYFSFLRPYVYDAYSDFSLLAEWVCVGIIATGTLLWLRSNLRTKMSEPIPYEWYQLQHAPKKHKQEIKTKSTEELMTVKHYIDEFVKEREKNDILLFIVKSSQDKGLTFDRLYDVVEDLVNYQDISPPRFAFLKEAEFIKKENIERRRNVLATTIQKLSDAYLQGK